MKFVLSLLVLATFVISLCGCDTLVTRRSLYSPKKGEGYWTRTLEHGHYKERGLPPDEKAKAESKRARVWGD